MSRSVDERIVQMQFDNKQFESGVQTSIKSLNNLKDGLNLDASANSLSNLERVGRSFSLSGIAAGVDSIANKFSTLGIIGITALQNITNSAINAGKRIISSLTIAPVMDGFREYETKMGAIQTILTNTQGGQKKVTQGAMNSIKETNAAAVDAIQEANDAALNSLRKANDKKLKELQKSADSELEIVNDKYKKESDALNKANDIELRAYQKLADNELDALDAKYEQESNDLIKAVENESNILQKAHQEKLSLYEEEYMQKLKTIDEEKYNKIKAIDDQISSINDLTKAEEEARQKKEQQDKLMALQKKVDTASTADELMAANKDLSDYVEELSRKQILKDRAAMIDNLKTDKKGIEEQYKLIEEQLKMEYNTKITNENDLYKLSINNLKEQQAELLKAMKASHEEEKNLIKERQYIEKEALKEQEQAKVESLRKTYDLEKKLMKERQDNERDALKEKQNDEIDAINKRNKAAIKSASSGGGGSSAISVDTGEVTKGSTLEDVNKALAELNAYSDKTIYNFAQMTDNVGKMTAAGLDLNDSVTVVKGLSNVAAGFGVDATRMAGATYQMSQALAAGSVKLMDWKSLESASMGGQMLQNALRDTAKSMGVVVDAGKPFRETLESGWLTTDIFVATMDKMSKDKSLLAAAENVTSFTKLLGVMSESVGSGWATTWEHILGDKNQSTKLFTDMSNSFNDMIKPSVDARNAMLEFWNANGGRDAIIQALSNSFKGLQAILKPIKQAFDEIFPAMTGEKLTAISKAISDVTEHFKIGEATASNLKNTFKGLFAVIDIVKQVLFALGGVLVSLVENILPVGDGLLYITGNIGEFLVSIDETLKKSGVLTTAMNSIKDVIQLAADGVGTALSNIISLFKGLKTVDLSGLDAFSEHVGSSFKPFTILGDIIQGTFSKIIDIVTFAAPIFYKLADIIGGAFDKMRTNIIKAIDSSGGNSILEIINGAFLAGMLLGLKKFIDSLTSITEHAGGFLDSMKGILDGVRGSLEAYQSNLKAGTLLKIATAIGILSVSLLLLSTIDPVKLASSMGAMTGMFIELFGSMAIFEKIMGSEGFKSMGKITRAMISLSIAILILSVAMTNLAKLDWDGITKGLISIASLSAILIKSAKSLSGNTKGLITASLGLILFSVSITILAEAVKKLGELDPSSLVKGLVGVGVLLTELSLFMKTTDLDGMGLGKGLGILTLAAALVVLSIAVEKLSQIDTVGLIKGLAGIGVLLTELSIFTKVTGDSKNIISTAIGLTILGAAMLIFASVIEKMGSLSIETIGKGLLAMGTSLGIIVVALNLMPKNIIGQAVGLLIMATSLTILSSALANMGNMSWEEIAKSLIALAGSLTIFAVAMAFMNTGLAGAAAMLIMAGALAILTPSLVILGNLSLSKIGKGLLAMAGAFTVIGIAGLLLGPLTPVILGLAAAIALFGIGCLAVGAGMMAFSIGLTALAAAGTAGAAALVIAITSIVGLIPFVLKTLAQGLIDFIKVIGDGAPIIADAFIKILTAIITTIDTMAPKIMSCLVNLIDSLLKALVDAVPNMIDSGMKLILGILKGIADNIADVVAAGIDVILQFIIGVTSKLSAIIDTAFKVIITFINGLADAIKNNHKALYNAISNLIMAIVDAVADLMPTIVDIGVNIIKGFITGIKSMAKGLVDAAKGVVGDAVDGIKEFLGIHSPSRVFAEIGRYSVEGLAVGLEKYSDVVKNSAIGVGKTAMDALQGAISNISDIVNNNLDANPVIRPVLDLSDIEAGANTLGSLLATDKNVSMTAQRMRTRNTSTSLSVEDIKDIVKGELSTDNQNGTNITQNVSIYSPTALSPSETARQNRRALQELALQI